jgi:hypothetical protein
MLIPQVNGAFDMRLAAFHERGRDAAGRNPRSRQRAAPAPSSADREVSWKRGFRFRRGTSGLTFVEVMVVLFAVAVMGALLLPRLAKPKRPPVRVHCLNNLRQVALGMSMWAADHADRFPWQVPLGSGGTLEYVGTAEVFRHFQVVSNELWSPKVLTCAADRERIRTTDFATDLSNRNVSYFVGLEAVPSRPQAVLVGDRHLTGGTMIDGNILHFSTPEGARWTREIHPDAGHIGLADGSVSWTPSASLVERLRATSNEFLRLAMPLVTQ